MRGVAAFLLGGLAALAALAATGPAWSQCYPGLACPTQEEPPSAEPGTRPNPSGETSARTRQQGIEYHYVGPVNPPDDWLALRTLPTAKAGERIMKMPEGTLFQVMEKRGDWWFVKLQDGQTGWAHNTWIRCCKYLNE